MSLNSVAIKAHLDSIKTIEEYVLSYPLEGPNGERLRRRFLNQSEIFRAVLRQAGETIARAEKAELDLCELREKLDDYRAAVDRMQTRLVEADRLFGSFNPHPDNAEADRALLTKLVDALIALPDETSPATYRERMQDYALTTLAVLKREGVIR